MMRKIWKYPQDVIQCVSRSSYCIDNSFIMYLFFKRNSITFDVSCGMLSNVIICNVISLVLRGTDTDSENVSLIRHSLSDGQKICSSNGVSLTGI